MEARKYDKIRNKITKMDFEGKYKQLSDWLFIFSFIGNAGSIFFAYFLIYPIFYNALSNYFDNNSTVSIVGGVFTILILFMFELIKRIILKNFSFDFIKEKYKIKNFTIVLWLIISMSLITLSFYFSINGAMNFADNTRNVENTYRNELTLKQDSINNIFQKEKDEYLSRIKYLEDNNNRLSELRDETPLNHITARREYHSFIEDNNSRISQHREQISTINNQLENILNRYEIEYNQKIDNLSDDSRISILVFILISSLIELLIIGGIYFKVFYDFTVYRENEPKLEKFFKKRDQYLVLLSYIYKNGKLNVGDVVVGVNRLKETLKDNHIQNPNKLVISFYSDMEYNNIIKTEGKRKYFVVDYEKAVDIITKLDDTIDILNKLK